MAAYREPDGLEKTSMILASLLHEMRLEGQRRWVQGFNLVVFGMIFICLVAGETLFATMMFSIIQIEILGTVFSGAAFALLVPTVIGYAHVRLHHEGDHFTKWWLNRLSGIGILIFALGVSMMIGFSAWQAAQDTVQVMATAPTGTLGGQSIGVADADASSGIAGWIAIIPNGLLFLGLSFGMIITISFASFCLALLWQVEIDGVCEELLTVRAAQWRRLREEVEDRLPDGWHARLWRRAPDSFFSVPLP